MTPDTKLEAILFYTAQPLKRVRAAKLIGVESDTLDEVIRTLKKRLKSGATTVVATDTHVELVTKPEYSELLDTLNRDTQSRTIGKAGAETLAIIAYRGPITRGEIDRIRGVNSAYMLRTLEMRGLIEQHKHHARTEYQPTPELYKHLGVTQRSELPQFTDAMAALTEFESTYADVS